MLDQRGRRRVIALILSGIFPGLGQFYNRHLLKGVIGLVLGLALSWLAGRAAPSDPSALARRGWSTPRQVRRAPGGSARRGMRCSVGGAQRLHDQLPASIPSASSRIALFRARWAISWPTAMTRATGHSMTSNSAISVSPAYQA